MGKIIQRLSKSIAITLADIKTSDVMFALFALFSVFAVGAIARVQEWNRSLGVLFFCLSPFAIVLLTVFYKSVISWMEKELKWFAGDVEEKQVETKATSKPKRDKLAYQMGLNIQKFREIFISIKGESSEEQKAKLILARNILNVIINDELLQANLIFVHAEQIREKIRDLDVKYQEYCMVFNTLGMMVFNDLDIKRKLWGAPGDNDSFESTINLITEELVDLLNKENKNVNTPKDTEDNQDNSNNPFLITARPPVNDNRPLSEPRSASLTIENGVGA